MTECVPGSDVTLEHQDVKNQVHGGLIRHQETWFTEGANVGSRILSKGQSQSEETPACLPQEPSHGPPGSP